VGRGEQELEEVRDLVLNLLTEAEKLAAKLTSPPGSISSKASLFWPLRRPEGKAGTSPAPTMVARCSGGVYLRLRS
jgi:hypothetical protein